MRIFRGLQTFVLGASFWMGAACLAQDVEMEAARKKCVAALRANEPEDYEVEYVFDRKFSEALRAFNEKLKEKGGFFVPDRRAKVHWISKQGVVWAKSDPTSSIVAAQYAGDPVDPDSTNCCYYAYYDGMNTLSYDEFKKEARLEGGYEIRSVWSPLIYGFQEQGGANRKWWSEIVSDPKCVLMLEKDLPGEVGGFVWKDPAGGRLEVSFSKQDHYRPATYTQYSANGSLVSKAFYEWRDQDNRMVLKSARTLTYFGNDTNQCSQVEITIMKWNESPATVPELRLETLPDGCRIIDLIADVTYLKGRFEAPTKLRKK